MPDRGQIEKAIMALEAQRPTLGDAVVDLAVAPLRQQLAALHTNPPEQQRKFIAVLFANIVLQIQTGGDGQEENEETVELVRKLWDRLDPIIEAHGGQIDKHMGSAVMALWGSDVASENDPEQAVRAALTMQAELSGLGAASRDEFASLGELQIQAGIHYGLAVLGEVSSTGEKTAIGDTVNTASRIQNAAATGEILVSNDIYRHVTGLFDVQALAPLLVKGKSEPLRLFRILKPRIQTFRSSGRGIEGVETRMIGRQNELEELQELLRSAVQTHTTRTALILGEAGVGKSRLLLEFNQWAEHEMPRITILRGRAAPHSSHLPYALLRSLFGNYFEIRDDDPSSAVLAKLESGIQSLTGPGQQNITPSELRRRAHFLGALAGYAVSDSPFLAAVRSDPRQLYDRALNDLAHLFLAATRYAPVLILLEDLHWADSQSLDAFRSILRKQPTLPMILVGTARPLLYERYPAWDSTTPDQTRLVLRRLTADQSLYLLQEILQKVEYVPPELFGLVIPRAEGNPFYIEEFIKMLIDDGIIRTTERDWQVDVSRLTELHVPSTLMGILQARLDGLDPHEKAIIQRASVIGRTFWENALTFLSTDQHGDRTLPNMSETTIALQHLKERDMIYQRIHSAFADTDEYNFKHILLRDVAYESVLKRDRRIYHARVAHWLVEVTHQNDRSDEYAALISEHFELAGEPEQAAHWYEQAYKQAIARFANDEAASFLKKAADLLPESRLADRYRLLNALEAILDLEGDRTSQAETLVSLENLLSTWFEKDPTAAGVERSALALHQAEYAESIGEYRQAAVYSQQAINLAGQLGQTEIQSAAYLVLGQTLINQTEFQAARSAYHKAIELARQAGRGDLEASSLRSLGRIASDQAEFSLASSYYQAALEMFRKTGNRRGEADALASLGAAALDSSDYPTALAFFEQSLHIKREIGDRRGEGRSLGNMGFIASDQGNYARSRAYFEQAKQIFHEVGDLQAESVALINLGSDALAQGNYTAARDNQLRAIEIQEKIGHRQGLCISLDNLSLITYHLNDYEGALIYCDRTQQLAEELGLRRMLGYSFHHRGHNLRALGRLPEACDCYAKAREVRLAIGERTMAVESSAGLAAVAWERGEKEAARAEVEAILDHLQTDGFTGMVEPFWVYWVCFEVLQDSAPQRANALLLEAYTALQERASKIGDETLRQSYLSNVFAHRQIVHAFHVKARAQG